MKTNFVDFSDRYGLVMKWRAEEPRPARSYRAARRNKYFKRPNRGNLGPLKRYISV